MSDNEMRVAWAPDLLLRNAYASKGKAGVSDVAKLYDEYQAARTSGRSRLAANLEAQYRDVLAAEHARRNPVTPSATPTLSARRHLDEVERLRADGKSRLAASYEEHYAGPLAAERRARTAELAVWQAQQEAQRAAAEPPAPTTTETAPKPPKPRPHLDHLDDLRRRGQSRAAATFEATHGPVLQFEQKQREAELRGEQEPLGLAEIMSAAPAGWPTPGGDK